MSVRGCRGALLPLLFVCLQGCAFFSPPLPPFRYVSVELHRGNDPPHHAAVGIAYRIVNVGDQQIVGLRVAFWAFDPAGAPFPAAGRNYIQAEASSAIDPGQEVEICTSLDGVFFYVPEGDVTITNFQIARVDLADGSDWTDPLGRFRYQNTIPNVEVPE